MELILEKYKPNQRDTWSWHMAKIPDVPEIVWMAQDQFGSEVDTVFKTDPWCYSKNVTLAVVEQSYDTHKCQLIVARNKLDSSLMAYSWLTRNHYMPYAHDECAEAAFAHIDLKLPLRTRITLMAQILQQWILWCQICQIPVLVSTTIREDQQGFINLHRAAGFSVRGSFAFIRVNIHKEKT